jgi:hypothetical protein
MKNGLFPGCLAIVSIVFVGYGQTAESPQKALINQYCIACHSERAKAAGVDSAKRITLDSLDVAHVSQNAEAWEKVVRKLRAGQMPPAGARRPEPANIKALVSWLENELDRDAVTHLPPPGAHRLNRTEYANAIRDLLALEIDPAKYLPSDDSSNGFDNMAGTLGLSSTLVEAYVSAAGKLSRLAIGEATTPSLVVYRVPEDTSQDYHVEGLPFGTRGGMLVNHVFPSDGEYTIAIIPIFGDNMSPQGFGTITNEKIQVLLDGQRVQLLNWQNARGGQGIASPGMKVRFTTKAGLHSIGVTFLATNLAPVLDLNKHFMRDTIQTGPTPGFTFFPHVGSIRVEGPFNALTGQDSPSRRKIFVCRPTGAADETACARRIITRLATEAFRRPATAEDVHELMTFYQDGRKEADFDNGIEMAIARVLAAPKFVYRIETEPANLTAGQAYRINDLDLASRLSFFLWSTGPDAELRNLAGQGKLKTPAVLEQQVRRMLKDPRAEALAVNFAGQWLNLRGMQGFSPLPMLYPDFDDPLRQSMRREVELLFDSIVREDRNVVDLLTADYTFVNERLAKHYGIPNIYGSQFRRVTLGPEMDVRRGLLGKGAILSTTSKPERTSPVSRGQWVMTNILGMSPPRPPADVPPLKPKTDDARGNGKAQSMRQMMLDHRVRADCIQCHSLMDPIGFSLENFDGIGLWRTDDAGEPVKASETLYDGTKVQGPAGLRQWLVGYSDQFVEVVAEKLLTYALGRGVEYRDMPLVRSIARDAAGNGNHFSALVLGVVKSKPFQMNMKLQETGIQNKDKKGN